MKLEPRWDLSRWERLERCPREYAFVQHYGIRPLEMPDAPNIGIAVHAGLAQYYSQGTLKAALDGVGRAERPFPVPVSAEAKRLLTAYHNYWADHHDWGHEQIVAVEQYHEGKFQDRHRHGSFITIAHRYDLVVIEDGRRVLVDHKTTSRESGDFLLEWEASNQFKAAAALWPTRETLTVVLNRIIRTHQPRFDRLRFTVEPKQVKSWLRDLQALDMDRRRYERSHYFPRRRAACVRRYGLCPYFSLCHGPGTAAAGEFKIPEGVDLKEAIK